MIRKLINFSVITTFLFLGCGLFGDDFMDIDPFGPGLADSTHYSIENDPSILEVKTELSRRYVSNGNFFKDVRVKISKGLLSHVLIKNGDVKINDKRLEERQEFITSTPVYYSDEIDWKDGTNYLVTITLSDSKSYVCSLATHENKIYDFIVPSKAKLSDELTVSWKGNNPLAKLHISCNLKKLNNVSISKGVDLDTSAQSYTFPAGYFSSGDDSLPIIEVTLALIAKQHGTAASEFKDGSKIFSELTIEKIVQKQ